MVCQYSRVSGLFVWRLPLALMSSASKVPIGYPLVTFDTVRQQNTNVAVPDDQHAPMGQMIKMRSYARRT